MKVSTYEGTVENGQIKLSESVRLPEHARVYVVVPDFAEQKVLHMRSPRLADPAHAADFKLEVIKEPPDACL
jgi:hypothetical protein